MAKKYLDYDGLLYFWQKLKVLFVTDVTYNSTSKKIQKTKAGTTSDVVTLSTVATSGSYNDLSNKPTIPSGVEKSTTTPKMDGTASVGSETKFAAGDHVHPSDTSRVPTTRTVNGHALSSNVTVTASDIGVESGAEVNQNAFSNIKVGTTTVSADTKTDTLELVAGSNVTLTPDATNDKVTIAATDTTYSDFTGATSSSAGTHGLVPAPSQGSYSAKVLSADATWKELAVYDGHDVTRVGVVDVESTTGELAIKINRAGNNGASYGTSGLMTGADKTKLNGIATGAEVNQNAFSVLKYAKDTNDTVRVAKSASSKTDDFLITGGGAVEVSSVTHSSVQGVKVSVYAATSSRDGYMSSGDKAKLDSLTITNGIIDASNLPSYVDDVVEAYARSGQTALSQNWLATGSASGTVITPEAGKIYVLMEDSGDYAANTQFRWGGTSYVKLSDGGVSSITNAEIDTIMAS